MHLSLTISHFHVPSQYMLYTTVLNKKKKKNYKEVLLKILHIITEPNNAIFTLSSLQQRIREKKTSKQTKTVSLHYRLDCSSSCNMGVIQLWVSKLPSVPFPFTKLCSWSR